MTYLLTPKSLFKEKVDVFLHLTNVAWTDLFNSQPRGTDSMLVCRACGKLDANNSTKICAHCKYDEDSDVRRVTVQVPFSTIVRGSQEIEISVSNYLRNSALRKVAAGRVSTIQPAQGSGHAIVCPLCGASSYAGGPSACSQCNYNKAADSRQLQVSVKCGQQYCETYLTTTANVQNYLNPPRAAYSSTAYSSTASQSGSHYCYSCAISRTRDPQRDSRSRGWGYDHY